MATIISPSVSTTTLPARRRGELREVSVPQVAESSELNRLLCAAVVSQKFCALLLNSPATALEAGCNGEKFHLTSVEREFVLSCKASSLAEFAEHLVRAGIAV